MSLSKAEAIERAKFIPGKDPGDPMLIVIDSELMINLEGFESIYLVEIVNSGPHNSKNKNYDFSDCLH